MNKLNGWWRLWLVGVVLSAIACVVIATATVPKRPPEIAEALTKKAAPLLMELEHAKSLSNPARSVEQIQGDLDEISNTMQNVVKHYDRLRLEHALTYGLVWLATCLGLFVALWTIRWVVRGFRKQPA